VKIGYVDTEGGPTPRAVGQIQGTPTIKAFVPKRASARNEKVVEEYSQGREVKDLLRFATSKMPNYVESVGDTERAAFDAKAVEWGLPRILVFSDKAGATSSSLKALSAEFRRRVLIAELKKSRAPRTVSEFAVGKFPTLLCLREGEAPLRFEKEPTYGRLSTFVGKCALRKPVLKKPAAARPEQAATEKTEL